MEVKRLKKIYREVSKMTCFKEILPLIVKHKNARDFFKLKDFFIKVSKPIKKLPKMLDEQIDDLIESFLLICEKRPTENSEKGTHSNCWINV